MFMDSDAPTIREMEAMEPRRRDITLADSSLVDNQFGKVSYGEIIILAR